MESGAIVTPRRCSASVRQSAQHHVAFGGDALRRLMVFKPKAQDYDAAGCLPVSGRPDKREEYPVFRLYLQHTRADSMTVPPPVGRRPGTDRRAHCSPLGKLTARALA